MTKNANPIATAEKYAEKYESLLDNDEVEPDVTDAAYEKLCKFCWANDLDPEDFTL